MDIKVISLKIVGPLSVRIISKAKVIVESSISTKHPPKMCDVKLFLGTSFKFFCIKEAILTAFTILNSSCKFSIK